MSVLERVFHALLFEALAIFLSITGLIIFTDHQPSALSGTMIVVATIAMAWNFVFNAIFDRIVTGKRELRNLKIRVIHTLSFEAGLLFFTVPVIAWILAINLWEAFVLDIGVTIFITLYAMVFNFCYDHIRVHVINRKVNRNNMVMLNSAP